MSLNGRIRVKERQLVQAQQALHRGQEELRRVLHRRMSSRTALALAFGGGLLAGWRVRPHRVRRNVRSATDQVKKSIPSNWLGNYLVWPFLLATARDLVVSRRPTRET